MDILVAVVVGIVAVAVVKGMVDTFTPKCPHLDSTFIAEEGDHGVLRDVFHVWVQVGRLYGIYWCSDCATAFVRIEKAQG